MFNKIINKTNSKISTTLLIFVVIVVMLYQGSVKIPTNLNTVVTESDPYVGFVMEAYDSIATNYWMQVGNYNKYKAVELPELFRLSLEKAADTILPTIKLPSSVKDRAGTREMVVTALSYATSTDTKRLLATQIIRIATQNLLPVGKSSLYSEQQVVDLRENVSNINPTNDLYKNLGVDRSASPAEIVTAYQKQSEVLKKATTTESKAKLQQIAYSKKVLTNEANKTLYDKTKIEPTIFSHIFNDTLYISIKKISPTTIQEFGLIIQDLAKKSALNNMIIDLRGNVGGDLAFAGAFTGLFLGINQYSFDLYRNESYQPIRTTLPKFAELNSYRDIAILTDGMTQSTAEVTAAVLKRLNRAHIVGTKTAGWGTVENTYPLKTVIDPAQKYTLYLVNNITLGDDNQPIEGRGILPDVDINNQDWVNDLRNYFRSASLIQTIQQLIRESPQAIEIAND